MFGQNERGWGKERSTIKLCARGRSRIDDKAACSLCLCAAFLLERRIDRAHERKGRADKAAAGICHTAAEARKEERKKERRREPNVYRPLLPGALCLQARKSNVCARERKYALPSVNDKEALIRTSRRPEACTARMLTRNAPAAADGRPSNLIKWTASWPLVSDAPRRPVRPLCTSCRSATGSPRRLSDASGPSITCWRLVSMNLQCCQLVASNNANNLSTPLQARASR